MASGPSDGIVNRLATEDTVPWVQKAKLESVIPGSTSHLYWDGDDEWVCRSCLLTGFKQFRFFHAEWASNRGFMEYLFDSFFFEETYIVLTLFFSVYHSPRLTVTVLGVMLAAYSSSAIINCPAVSLVFILIN
jgi:hypothetical protein